jgi:GTPase Era involved in 16S rRNA processing
VEEVTIHPVAGSTNVVSITQIGESGQLFLVNTPGMGDVLDEITERAEQVLHHIDLFLYVLNAQGGVQQRELDGYAAVRAYDRPTLVVLNKVDTIKGAERARLFAHSRAALGVDLADFRAAAFDPLPQLEAEPLGVREVRGWIEEQLRALGKDSTVLPWVSGER